MRRIQSRELPQQSLRGNNVVQPLELATGFEPRIIQQGKKFRRFTWNISFRSAHLPLIISEFPSVPSLRVVWMPDRRIGSVDGRANSV
jgi:hypothetical protein